MRDKIRFKHYSQSTEKTYIEWIRQFNMYHHFTVDEHLLRAIGILAEIERGELAEQHPLANEIIHTLENRRALFVAVFLHDIAKGRK